jgi:predicted nucleic acid-binding Zn ribbon protein
MNADRDSKLGAESASKAWITRMRCQNIELAAGVKATCSILGEA